MKTISSSDAAALLEDGWTVSTSGFTGSGHPEGITTAIEKRFLDSGRPRDLTLIYAAGQGDRDRRGTKVLYVTERAVFEMREGRLTLAEIAPGVDLERQVLAQLAAVVAVAPDLKTMDARIFRDAPMLAART